MSWKWTGHREEQQRFIYTRNSTRRGVCTWSHAFTSELFFSQGCQHTSRTRPGTAVAAGTQRFRPIIERMHNTCLDCQRRHNWLTGGPAPGGGTAHRATPQRQVTRVTEGLRQQRTRSSYTGTQNTAVAVHFPEQSKTVCRQNFHLVYRPRSRTSAAQS